MLGQMLSKGLLIYFVDIDIQICYDKHSIL